VDFSLAWSIDSPAFEANFFDYWRTPEDDDRRNQKSEYVVQILVRHLKSILNSAGQLVCQAESTTFQMAYNKETSGRATGGLGVGDLPQWQLPWGELSGFSFITLELTI
jgi:hypothetical protein